MSNLTDFIMQGKVKNTVFLIGDNTVWAYFRLKLSSIYKHSYQIKKPRSAEIANAL